MLAYKGMSEVKDDILGTLKMIFSFDQDFKYDLVNPNSSYLKIYDGFPRTTRTYPCIIVTNATVKPKIWGIGKEFREYTGIGHTQAKEFGGSLEFTITMDCAAESVTEREQLADRVTMSLWWVAREYLEEGGIIIRSINSTGESDQDYANDKIFVNSVSIDCWVEWSEIISYDEIEAITIKMREIRDIRRLEGVGTTEAIDIWVNQMINKQR